MHIDWLSTSCTRYECGGPGPGMARTERPVSELRATYPRLLASVYFGRTVWPLFRRRKPADGSLGGVKVYTDETPREGSRLAIEIFLPDESSIMCKVEVAWVDRLPPNAAARCEVGLQFTAIHPHDRQRLSAVLEHC
jgi:PilZ domain